VSTYSAHSILFSAVQNYHLLIFPSQLSLRRFADPIGGSVN
jgi:hypothetical protein